MLEKIGKYTKADLDQPALEPVRDELYYLLGRYHYPKGTSKTRSTSLAVCRRRSEFYPKAKFLEGLTHVRENHGKIAADAFKAILRKVKQYDDPDKVPKALKESEELANLSLGRVFYSTKQYNQAIKYFEKLPARCARGAAPDWRASLFEASWAYFQEDGDSKALGNIHSINSPYFETEFYPESYILKAVIYFNRCNYDRSAGSDQRVQRHLSRPAQGDRRHPREVSRQRAVLRLRRSRSRAARRAFGARAARRRGRARRSLAA